MFAFVVLDVCLSVLTQEIAWENVSEMTFLSGGT